MNLCVDIESFFGAGACFGLASKADETLTSRITRRVEEEASRSHWTYLSPKTLDKGMNHYSRRLKGGHHGHHEGEGGGGCFPGEALAEVRHKGKTQVASLEV